MLFSFLNEILLIPGKDKHVYEEMCTEAQRERQIQVPEPTRPAFRRAIGMAQVLRSLRCASL